MNSKAPLPHMLTVAIEAGELADRLRDPDPFVRGAALGRALEGGKGVLELVRSELSDDYPLVRREAVRALARLGGPEAVKALVTASAHDLSAEVREEAVSALAGMLRRGSDAAGVES